MNCQQAPLIEFVRSDLGKEETQRVLSHLESCPECRERLQVIVGLEALYTDRKAPRRFPQLRLLAAALALAILIPFSYIYFEDLLQRHSGLASLATQKQYTYFPLQTRSDSRSPPTSESSYDARQRAFAAYGAGDFSTAREWFEKAVPDPELLFYQGVTQYFLGQHDDASQNLKKAAELERRWQLPALWYQANIALKTEKEQQARDALNQIVSAKREFEVKARDLLNQLPR